MSIQKTALVVCVSTLLASIDREWAALEQLQTVLSMQPSWKWIIYPSLVLALVFDLTIPAFCFALYRSHFTLQMSPQLKSFAWGAAVTFGLLLASDLWRWVKSLSGVWAFLPSGRALLTQSTWVAGIVSGIGYILLLAGFATLKARPEPATSSRRLLIRVAKFAVVAYGLRLTFELLRVILVPYTQAQLRSYTLEMGVQPPSMLQLASEPGFAFLRTLCLLAAPLIVCRGLPRPSFPSEEAQKQTQGL